MTTNHGHSHGAAAPCEAGRGGVVGGLSHTKQLSLDSFRINLAAPEQALRRVKRLKRSVWASGHLHAMADTGHRNPVCWFVTLTYRPGVDWLPEHVSDAIRKFRKWCKAACIPCRYTWVAELQHRGAVHYHLLAWLPPGVNMRHWDKQTAKRQAFWPHGMTNTQPAKSGVGYLMKYLSKLGELTKFPKGLRLYGIGGLDQQARAVRAWYNLPGWAKLSHGVGQLTRRVGGLCDRQTGELLPPMFRIRFTPGDLVITRIRETLSRFAPGTIPDGHMPGAYSAWPAA